MKKVLVVDFGYGGHERALFDATDATLGLLARMPAVTLSNNDKTATLKEMGVTFKWCEMAGNSNEEEMLQRECQETEQYKEYWLNSNKRVNALEKDLAVLKEKLAKYEQIASLDLTKDES
jgi:hypothetical protein